MKTKALIMLCSRAVIVQLVKYRHRSKKKRYGITMRICHLLCWTLAGGCLGVGVVGCWRWLDDTFRSWWALEKSTRIGFIWWKQVTRVSRWNNKSDGYDQEKQRPVEWISSCEKHRSKTTETASATTTHRRFCWNKGQHGDHGAMCCYSTLFHLPTRPG